MITREEYIESLKQKNTDSYGRSEPKYKCPHCGGNVRKLIDRCVCLASYPSKEQYLYECDDCNYNEYITE